MRRYREWPEDGRNHRYQQGNYRVQKERADRESAMSCGFERTVLTAVGDATVNEAAMLLVPAKPAAHSRRQTVQGGGGNPAASKLKLINPRRRQRSGRPPDRQVRTAALQGGAKWRRQHVPIDQHDKISGPQAKPGNAAPDRSQEYRLDRDPGVLGHGGAGGAARRLWPVRGSQLCSRSLGDYGGFRW